MRPTLTPAAALMAGMIAAQFLFTFFIYFSDSYLYNNLTAMKQAGYYLLVPNELVMPTLQQWTPAFCGGLFFTLTVGAGLSLAGWFAVFLWRVFPKHRRITCGVFLAFGGYVLFRLNDHGLNPLVTVICLIIPVVAGLTAIKCCAKLPAIVSGDFRMALLHVAVIAVIAMVWIPKVNADVFTTIRDHLLLTNSFGQKVNDFYYKYTLYPAEAFKSLDQKMLKTVDISIQDKALNQRLLGRLLHEDYVPVVPTHPADLTVTRQDNRLIFQNNGRTVHTSSVPEFFSAPSDHLMEISKKNDQQHFFRKMTFISLIAASPLLCYILLYAVLTILLVPIPSVGVRSVCAAFVCLMAGGMAALPVYNDTASAIAPSETRRYLGSDQWQDRVSALKYISDSDDGIPIDGLEELPRLVHSPWIAERYWLAKVTGNSRSPQSGQITLSLLDDPQPNVACMALYSLGKRGKPAVIPQIIHKINTSGHWYVQWYAYKALKRLGWEQQIGPELQK
ncbi:MAG: hypothetical protein WA081_13175 [Desulfosalsimonadaceae bacterium]